MDTIILLISYKGLLFWFEVPIWLFTMSYHFLPLIFIVTYVRILFSVMGDKQDIDELEYSLQSLMNMAGNPECTSYILNGLFNSAASVLELTCQLNGESIARAVGTIMKQLIQVSGGNTW